MATLINTRKEWLQKPDESFMDFYTRMDAIHSEIAEKTPEKLYRYPVADNYAFYYIVSDKPLKLEHMPVGDAYQVDYAHMRGLRLADIQRERDFNARWKSL